MKIKQKLKSRAGFTLAETLLAVLILLLVSGIVANGIPAAKNAYEKVVLGANAQVLLSTTVTALRDELGTAKDIEIDGTTITYYNTSLGAKSRIYLYEGDLGGGESGEDGQQHYPAGAIMLQEYLDAPATIRPAARALVSASAATERLYITYGGAPTLAGGILNIPGLSVSRENGASDIATLSTLYIRIIQTPETAA